MDRGVPEYIRSDNGSDADISVGYTVSLSVNGGVPVEFPVNPPHPAGIFFSLEDFDLGSLSVGTYTLRLELDPGDIIAESDESDNVVTKTFQVTGSPNLQPFRPTGWSAPIVVSTRIGTNTDANEISPLDTIYLDLAWTNSGNVNTSFAYDIALSVNGEAPVQIPVNPPHQAGTYFFLEDIELGPLTMGTYAVRLEVDSGNDIVESDESDNIVTKTFQVTGSPNLEPTRPSGWTAPIVLSTRRGTNADASTISPLDTIYLDYAWANTGTVDIDSPYDYSLSFEGGEPVTVTVDPPHTAGSVIEIEDLELGSLPVGLYTLRLELDTTGAVDESSESDNSATKTFRVTGEPNLAPHRPGGWDTALVVSTEPGTNSNGDVLTAADFLYVDWAVTNDGTVTIDRRYSVRLEIDGQTATTWFVEAPHAPGAVVTLEDYQRAPLQEGGHSFRLVIDSKSQISESRESDNVVRRDVTVEKGVFLIFPRVQNTGDTSAGLALANPTAEEAKVTLFYLGQNVHSMDTAGVSPIEVVIPPDGQEARTLSDLFGPEVADTEGWVLASSDNLGGVGFFLTFSADVTRIDGAEAVLFTTSEALVFPEILSGDQFTEITLVGIGDVELELYGPEGDLVEERVVTLPQDGNGQLSSKVRDLFTSDIPSSSYVLARGVVIGYETFGSDEFIAGRNAIRVSEIGREIPTALFGAQVAETPDITTTVTLINPTNRDAELILSAFETGVSDQQRRRGAAPFLVEEGSQATLALSPDGDWLAYSDTITGNNEIYVRRFPSGESRVKVSENDGWGPRWSRDGRELFYRSAAGSELYGVSIDASTELRLGNPRLILSGPYQDDADVGKSYDVLTDDGQYFVFVEKDVDYMSATELIVVPNWFEELERLLPTDN